MATEPLPRLIMRLSRWEGGQKDEGRARRPADKRNFNPGRGRRFTAKPPPSKDRMPGVRGKLGGAIVAITFLIIAPLYAESVRGTVVDSTGRAVADAVVSLDSYIDATDESGEFLFDNIPPGDYELAVSHVSYRRYEREISVSEGAGYSRVIELEQSAFIAKERSISVERSQSRIVVDEGVSAGEAASYIKRLPGATVIEGGEETSISIRGSRPEEVLVVIDGVPMPRNEGGVCDLSSISAGNIQSIEVLTENIPVEYASRAPAGVVLIETAPVRAGELSCAMTGGSFGAYGVDLEADLSPMTDLKLRIYGDHGYSMRDFEYEAGDSIATRINNYEKSTSFGLKANYSMARLDFTGDFSTNLRRDGMPGDLNHPTPEAFKEGEYYRGNLLAKGLFGRLLVKSRLSGYHSENYYSSPRPYVYSPVDADHLTFGMTANLTASYEIGPAMPGIGGEYFMENYSMTNNLNSDRDIGPVDRDIYSLWFESPFAEEVYGFDFKLSPSIRLDAIDDGEFGSNGNLSAGLSRSMGDFSFGVSASYSEAYRLPTYGDLYWLRDAYSEGNPDLSPEKSYKRNARLYTSYNTDLVDVYISADFFSRTVDSVIVWKRGFDGLYRPYNLNREETSGREDIMKIDVFDILSVSWSNTTLESILRSPGSIIDGNWLPYRPNYTQYLSAEIEYCNASLELDYNWVGKRYLLEANTKWTKPYSTINISGNYTIRIHDFDISTHLSIKNITDTSYEILEGYPMPGRNYTIKTTIQYGGIK